MPYDIDINMESISYQCMFSIVVEVFSAVQLLVEPHHHDFATEFTNQMYKTLTNESQEILSKMRNLSFHGLELYEFILDLKIFDDVELFIEQLGSYTDDQFITALTDHKIDKTTYRQLNEHKISLESIGELIPWLYKESISELSFMLYHTRDFIKGIVNLLSEVYHHKLFTDIVSAQQANYIDSIKNIEQELRSKKPLDVAQELMGKKFGTVFPYKEFIFCPSYFISPHKLRVHHHTTNIVFYDLRRNILYLNQVGEQISNTLKILSDRTRIEILRQLSSGPKYGKSLAISLDLTTATISHHMEQLKSIGLIEEDKVKNIKYFRLNEIKFNELLELTDAYIKNKL